MSQESSQAPGDYMYELARELWPINRSITGPGLRETLAILAREMQGLGVRAVSSGSQAFDWRVPDEWSVREAWIEDAGGRRIVDFADNNLHVLGYSTAVDAEFPLEELDAHLYSLPDKPDAIPYVTSYYQPRWGFCLSHRLRESMQPGNYRVRIDADHYPGVLNYGELLLPGKHTDEVLLSTYICHPSMANNELSGPVVATALVNWLGGLENRHYSYRFVFVPETIGSITFISRNLAALKKNVVAGFNITCVGDEGGYSYLPSRHGDTLADRALRYVLSRRAPDYRRYNYLDRGSDERQYCSPGVDLPVATFCRSKFGEYAEYHTSLDDLSLISAKALQQSFELMCDVFRCLETSPRASALVNCEPRLGPRGLYPTLGRPGTPAKLLAKRRMNVLAYADGRSLVEIAEATAIGLEEVTEIIELFEQHGLVALARD